MITASQPRQTTLLAASLQTEALASHVFDVVHLAEAHPGHIGEIHAFGLIAIG
jgi:hypothetical protein